MAYKSRSCRRRRTRSRRNTRRTRGGGEMMKCWDKNKKPVTYDKSRLLRFDGHDPNTINCDDRNRYLVKGRLFGTW
jgi:hypothetical protein